jgi:hypothetical protein
VKPQLQAGLHGRCCPLLLALSLLAGGCAANSGWQTEVAADDFVEGTHVLGELILSTTRDQALSDEGILRGWSDKLFELGYTDADIVDGSEATVWAYCYGHNSGVPLCAHHGHYVVHVPIEFREGLNFDDNGVPGSHGDLVEIELVMTASRNIVGKWVGVYRNADDWQDCRVASLERGSVSTTMSILSGVGPPRAEWIECDNAGSEGWVRRPVPGAPPSDSFPVSEWIKPAGR